MSRNPSVILATTIAAVRSAQRASVSIPIVMTTINDPVGAELIASLGRPGGNTTGIANLSEDLTPRNWKSCVRSFRRRARSRPCSILPTRRTWPCSTRIRGYAGTFGATVEPAELKAPRELERVFGAIVGRAPDALLVINDASILDMRARIMALALQHRLPVASSYPEFTDAGALAGYGPPRFDLYRRSAYYVKRILDGAKPADLPVEQPTRIELSANLKTAKALGIAIPDSFLARVDRVIE